MINQPSSTAIYFAVDYDASTTDVSGVITQYFTGVSDAFNALGVYGSGAVCQAMYANIALVTHTMLAQSTGWRGYSTYTGWRIKQGSTITVSGIKCDSDIANGVDDYGGFMVGMQE
jgi:hypothetical protein